MQPTIRSYYNLEEIWGDKPVRLKLGAPKPVEPVRKPVAKKKANVSAGRTPTRRDAVPVGPMGSEAVKPARKTSAKTPAKSAFQSKVKAAAKPAGKSASKPSSKASPKTALQAKPKAKAKPKA
jgi:ribosome-associated protein